ncbi:putative cell division protein Fic [Paenibacillus agaridevorans]|uniref:Putative cell division protein Fic n=1 Tax=Paenibacillus agaridevorans TaxID=171404 RepID=A0A2R5EWQ8_9BACL|nr:putative cell division protein Fic [Paenibacillus agaridevorans]
MNLVMLNEAVQSTKIEGTQVTLDEVLEVEAHSRKINKDIQEVLNYYHALREGMNRLAVLPLSTRLFKEMHVTLISLVLSAVLWRLQRIFRRNHS